MKKKTKTNNPSTAREKGYLNELAEIITPMVTTTRNKVERLLNRIYHEGWEEGNDFEQIVCSATNQQLYQMKDRIEKEIMLSETSIREGFEKRK